MCITGMLANAAFRAPNKALGSQHLAYSSRSEVSESGE